MNLGTDSWGMAWGAVDEPTCAVRNAPLDAALLAPFGRCPVLTSYRLFELVRKNFAQPINGRAAPISPDRVREWVRCAVVRGLVEKDTQGALRLTTRGEKRRNTLRWGTFRWAGWRAPFGIGRVFTVLFLVVTAVGATGVVLAFVLKHWTLAVPAGFWFVALGLYLRAAADLEPLQHHERESR